MSSPEVGNITPQSERNYASDYWEVAIGTHNIWGYIGEARPLYMKMNELWQEVLYNVTKIDFTQDITVSRAFQKYSLGCLKSCTIYEWTYSCLLSVMTSSNLHLNRWKTCRLSTNLRGGEGEQASDFKFPSRSFVLGYELLSFVK